MFLFIYIYAHTHTNNKGLSCPLHHPSICPSSLHTCSVPEGNFRRLSSFQGPGTHWPTVVYNIKSLISDSCWMDLLFSFQFWPCVIFSSACWPHEWSSPHPRHLFLPRAVVLWDTVPCHQPQCDRACVKQMSEEAALAPKLAFLLWGQRCIICFQYTGLSTRRRSKTFSSRKAESFINT